MRGIILTTVLGALLVCACGCSVPKVARYDQLQSISREEKSIKRGFGRKKVVIIQDFRENDSFDEDIDKLKEKVEAYISEHPELSDAAKNNLRELKIAEGTTAGEVRLLLGKPDKVTGRKNTGGIISETWIYKINREDNFTIFIFPILFMREGYYLHFRDNRLTLIERHYLQQVLESSGAGFTGKEKP